MTATVTEILCPHLHNHAPLILRLHKGGAGFKYTIPLSALAKLGPMNKDLDPPARYNAVMAADGLYQVEPAP